MFDEQSRYAHLPTLAHTFPDGRSVVYVRRRLLPAPENYAVAGRVTVTDSDRPDLVAHRGLGTVRAFYQIADANRVMHPAELTDEPGRILVIPIPRPTVLDP